MAAALHSRGLVTLAKRFHSSARCRRAHPDISLADGIAESISEEKAKTLFHRNSAIGAPIYCKMIELYDESKLPMSLGRPGRSSWVGPTQRYAM